MGYYVTGRGLLAIPASQHEAALQALKDLNNRNDLKYGGSGVPSTEQIQSMTPQEDLWFSWMPWNYNETVTSVADVLELLGFEVSSKNDPSGAYIDYSLRYDNKMGQEDLFLGVLAKFVTAGWLEWTGEDHAMWRNEFGDGEMTTRKGRTVWE